MCALKNVAEVERGEVWIFQGRQEIVEKAQQILSSAEKRVVIVTSREGLILIYQNFNKTFDRLLEKGVKIQLWIPRDRTIKSATKELGYICDVRHLPYTLPIFLVSIDGEELLLANLTSAEQRPESSSEKDLVLLTNNANLLNLLSGILSNSLKNEKNAMISPLRIN